MVSTFVYSQTGRQNKMTTVGVRHELGKCPLCVPSARPKHVLTFYHVGRSMKWLEVVEYAEEALKQFKIGRITSARVNQIFKIILDRCYNVGNVANHDTPIMVRLNERSVCNILNAANVRVYDDGSTD